MGEKLLFTGGSVYVDGRFQQADLLVEDGRIAAIGQLNPAGLRVKNLGGRMLVPGFLDLHTHGGDGVDVNAATAQDFGKISRFFARHGTTGWLCSILTDTPEQTLWCIGQAKAAMEAPADGAQLLGIHLEGPFLSTEYKGAMPEHLLRTGDAELFHQYQRAAEGAIRYMTVSPEVEGVVELIEALAGQVTIAIGHSGADYETSIRACAGQPALRRCPGAGPALWGLCWSAGVLRGHLRRAAPAPRLRADAPGLQGLGQGGCRHRLHPGRRPARRALQAPGVNDVVVEDGDAKLASNGVRAGSTLTTGQALKNLVKFTGESVERVLPLLTANPARLVGLSYRKGSIAPGKDADLVVLDEELNVRETYVAGRLVYAGECE